MSLEEGLWTAEPSKITWWAGHAHPTVRRIVASHETCPPEIIDRMAQSMDGPAILEACRIGTT